jgi:O-antigen/teichoic acid export membrane protein
MWLKSLGKDSVIYGLGGVLAKSVSIITIPIYTRIFTPEIYGRLDMLITLGSFLVLLMVMGTDSAQSFYFFNEGKGSKASRKKVVSTIFLWRIIWGVLIFSSALLMIEYIDFYFFRNQVPYYIYLLIFSSSYLVMLNDQSTNIFRLIRKPFPFIFITFLLIVISSTVSIILLLKYNFSYSAVFIGNIMGLLVILPVSWFINKSYLSIRHINVQFSIKMLKFSFPFLPEAFIWYIFTTVDRWFIIKLLNEHQLGIYSIGAKIGLLLVLVTNAFRMGWWPIAMENINKSNGAQIFKSLSRYYLGILSVLVIVITTLSKDILFLISTEPYYPAFIIAGPLALQGVLSSYNLIISPGIWKTEMTKYYPFCLIVGALTNIALNLLLIPVYGILGAAISTAISYLIWIIILLVISEKLWFVGFPVFRLSIIFCFLCFSIFIISNLLISNYSFIIISTTSLFSILIIIMLTFKIEEYEHSKKYLIKIFGKNYSS